MELLIDIAIYAIGAAILIVAALALVGLVAGLIASARAWKEVRRFDDSGLLAEIETRRQAFEALRRARGQGAAATNGKDATAWGAAVERVVYPSRTFDKVTGSLIDRGARFVVTVAANSRKRSAVERELPAMVHFHSGRRGLFREFIDKMRTMGLWSCIATAILHRRYLVIYDIAADIIIHFEPKPPSGL